MVDTFKYIELTLGAETMAAPPSICGVSRLLGPRISRTDVITWSLAVEAEAIFYGLSPLLGI
jgi:hypothetical protein